MLNITEMEVFMSTDQEFLARALVGGILWELRRASKWPQSEIAKFFGISQSLLSRVEQGHQLAPAILVLWIIREISIASKLAAEYLPRVKEILDLKEIKTPEVGTFDEHSPLRKVEGDSQDSPQASS